ncbi:MAG: sporulation integral membrane protein YtvI [Clostridia bacterium]|nr:sporulation integral membrane protein YtvI [Clostridia bacterium]
MRIEKKVRFIVNTLFWLIIAGAVYLLFKYAIFVVMPFLIGFLIAASLNPLLRYLGKRYDMKRKPAGILLLLLFYATIGMLLTILVVRVVVMIGEFSSELPGIYADTIEPALGKLFDTINGLIAKLDDRFVSDRFAADLGGIFTSIRSSLGTAVSDISVKALTKLSSVAAAIPGVVVNLVFAVISSFFFTVDYEKILSFLKAHLPSRAVEVMTGLRDKFFSIIVKYLRSYSLIMLITFGELFLGLTLTGIGRPFMMAVVIALFDVLPVLGTGGILLPWALIGLIRQDYRTAIGLLLTWGVISVVRNIIEPKIVGRQMGLNPLVTLMSMFVGTKLFGIVGLFLLPISLSIAISVWREKQGEPSR